MSFTPGPQDNAAGYEHGSRGPRRGHKARNVLIVAAAVVIVAALIAGGYVVNLARTYNEKSETIETAFPEESTRPQKQEPVNGKAPINILVMGSDSRGATEVDAVNGSATDQRADTLMLMHVPADRKNIYTISLMRDLWVGIPNHGEAKINAALALGGVPLMVQTVESIFRQRIDHVAMVDFEGFSGLTGALGGIDVQVSVPFASSSMPDQYFAPGSNTLNGTQALAFVRERYAFADGDYQRVRNQQSFLKGVIAKTLNADTLSNPVTVNNLVGAVSPFISVDKGVDAATVAGLAMELKDVRPQNMVMFTLPTLGIGTSADKQSIVRPHPEAIEKIAAALSSGTLGDYVAANNFEKGN